MASSSFTTDGPGTYSVQSIITFLLEELQNLCTKLRYNEGEAASILETSSSSEYTNRLNQDHHDILLKKERFVEQLIDSIIATSHEFKSIGKNMTSFQALINSFIKLHHETDHENQLRIEQLKMKQAETAEIVNQMETFSKLLDDGSDDEETSSIFQVARKDLETILNIKLAQKQKEVFITTITALIDASTNNMDDKDQQFVELTVQSLRNPALLWLIDSNIILRHPTNSKKYRICVND